MNFITSYLKAPNRPHTAEQREKWTVPNTTVAKDTMLHIHFFMKVCFLLSSPSLPGKSDKDIDFLICFMHKSYGFSTLLSSTNNCCIPQTCSIFFQTGERTTISGELKLTRQTIRLQSFIAHMVAGGCENHPISLFFTPLLPAPISFFSSSNSLSLSLSILGQLCSCTAAQ